MAQFQLPIESYSKTNPESLDDCSNDQMDLPGTIEPPAIDSEALEFKNMIQKVQLDIFETNSAP